MFSCISVIEVLYMNMKWNTVYSKQTILKEMFFANIINCKAYIPNVILLNTLILLIYRQKHNINW